MSFLVVLGSLHIRWSVFQISKAAAAFGPKIPSLSDNLFYDCYYEVKRTC